MSDNLTTTQAADQPTVADQPNKHRVETTIKFRLTKNKSHHSRPMKINKLYPSVRQHDHDLCKAATVIVRATNSNHPSTNLDTSLTSKSCHHPRSDKRRRCSREQYQ